jgi:hypothetical protein
MAELKAKVFISCGQKKDSKEVELANAIAKVLEDMYFEPYVASQEHTLSGLKENIFWQLDTSEYFLFIDFAREQLENSPEHRGSLYSHQELAVASYLGLEVVAFQQRGVKMLDGMIGTMQLNPVMFDDLETLPALVSEQIKKANWRANWKNTIEITRTESEFQDANIKSIPNPQLARFFHLTVNNHNVRKIALNCAAYLEKMTKLPENISDTPRTTELKWAGYTQPTVAIMPESHRELDALYVLHNTPYIMHFSCFSDSSYYMMPVLGSGRYQLEYVVISENFAPARITVEVNIGNSIDDISLIQVQK